MVGVEWMEARYVKLAMTVFSLAAQKYDPCYVWGVSR